MTPAHIKQIRTSVGLSAVGMAKLLQVDRATIYRWEEGSFNPTGPAIILLGMIERGDWPK